MRHTTIISASARLGLLLLTAVAVGPVGAQNQTPANVPPEGARDEVAARGHYNRGAALVNEGNSRAAADEFRLATEADPLYALAYYQRGIALFGQVSANRDGSFRLPPGMAESLQTYLALDPNGPYSNQARETLTAVRQPLSMPATEQGRRPEQEAATGRVGAQNQMPTNAAASAPEWRDPGTGLMWTLNDNGSDINQPDALKYCLSLGLGGPRDWRLPEIDELAKIYDASVVSGSYLYNGKSYNLHLKGGIQMTACCGWSATPGNAGEDWTFNFELGPRASPAVGYSNVRRALCVRRAGD